MAACCAPCGVGLPCASSARMAGLFGYDRDAVIAKKDEVNQDVKNVGLMVGACPGKLSIDESLSWDSFRADWYAFYTKPIPQVFGVDAEMDATLRYQEKAASWRSILTSRACPQVGPAPAPPPPPSGPEALAHDWIGMLKVAVPAAAVIAVVVLAAPFAWELAAAKKGSKQR